MALVPHDLAQEIVAWGVRNVEDKDLYLDGEKFGRELESHVTIKYGLLTDDGKHVRRSFNDSKPFKAKLGKVRHFQPPELPFDVLTIEVISEDLQKANEMVCDKFECAEGLPSDEYKPHITIAYMKRDSAKEYVGSDEFEGREIELDTLIFSPNKGNRTYFSIGTDKESSFVLEKMDKTASGDNFLPSLFNAPNNEWQFEHGGDDQEIGVDPDAVSDEQTFYAPCTVGKPRTKDMWRQFLSMFSNPFSKNDTGKIESALNDNLVYIGNIRLDGKKTRILKVEVPQDLLDQYFATVIDMKNGLKNSKMTKEDFNESEYWSSLDRARTKIHDELVKYAFNRLFAGKNWYDFPGVSFDIRDKISDFIEDMVPRDDLPKQAAYDKELEEKEKDELGEDQTAHEYAKDFKDLNLIKKPHNTTWLNTMYQDQEPSKPLPVTYSPQISNEDNLDQNSPGGFPRRFMGKPKGEWFSNEGEANHILIDMLKNREAAIDSMTVDVTAKADPTLWEVAIKVLMPNGKSGVFSSPSPASHMSLIDTWKDGDFNDELGITEPTNAVSIDEGYVDEFGRWLTREQASSILNREDELYSEDLMRIQNPRKRRKKLAVSLNKTAITRQYALYIGGRLAIRTLTRQKAVRICQERFPEAFASGNYEIKEEAYKVSKQAGSQSASVPDYLCDEFKTEQIMNDTDEEPYVNHDQRDYSYGLHDSPENTGYNIGWPQDNQRAVVRLDTLENPAYRNDPLGIGEYHITYYNAMPMSDGLEQGNEN
jgi:hypothetical protein